MSTSKKPTKGRSLLAMNEELLVIVRCVERRNNQIKTLTDEVSELVAKAKVLDETIEAMQKAGVRL